MTTGHAQRLPAYSFQSRRGALHTLAAFARAKRRWHLHTRLAALKAALCDLHFNPFLFQIESTH